MYLTTLIGIALATTCCASGIVLENTAIRVEIEPKTFSIRYFGRPGGRNFLDTVFLTDRQRNGGGWITPGGLMTDVLPINPEFPELRRGPATVIEHRKDYVLLMGALSPVRQLQIKKEYRLEPNGDSMTYKLSVLSTSKTDHRVAIRVTAQLHRSGVVSIPVSLEGPTRLVHGLYPDWRKISSEPMDGYTLPLAGRMGRKLAVLRSQNHRVSVSDGQVVWTREAAVPSAGESGGTGIALYTLVDDPSDTCQVAFEAGQRDVNVGVPLVYTETWTLMDVAAHELARVVPVENGAELP